MSILICIYLQPPNPFSIAQWQNAFKHVMYIMFDFVSNFRFHSHTHVAHALNTMKEFAWWHCLFVGLYLFDDV